jgi:nicotinamide riboside kinase
MPREQEPLKIAFVGACCSGKSTLIDHFSQQYKGNKQIAYVPEGAREFLSNQNPQELMQMDPFDIQKGIRRLTLQNEKTVHETQARVILCDSSVVDQVVYTRVFVGKKESEELYNEIGDWVGTYNRFYMLNPHEVAYQTDEVRTQTSEERQRIHDTFLEVFEEKGIGYETLSGTVEERFATVDKLVRSVFPQK